MSMLAALEAEEQIDAAPPAKGPPEESETVQEMAERFRNGPEQPVFDKHGLEEGMNDVDETQDTLRADGRSEVHEEDGPASESAVLDDEAEGADEEAEGADEEAEDSASGSQDAAAVKIQALARGRQTRKQLKQKAEEEIAADKEDLSSELSYLAGETEEEHEARMKGIHAQVKELMATLGARAGSLEEKDQQLREATRTIKKLEKEKRQAELRQREAEEAAKTHVAQSQKAKAEAAKAERAYEEYQKNLLKAQKYMEENAKAAEDADCEDPRVVANDLRGVAHLLDSGVLGVTVEDMEQPEGERAGSAGPAKAEAEDKPKIKLILHAREEGAAGAAGAGGMTEEEREQLAETQGRMDDMQLELKRLEEVDRRRREEKMQRAKDSGALELQEGDRAMFIDKRARQDVPCVVLRIDRNPVPPIYTVRFDDGRERDIAVDRLKPFKEEEEPAPVGPSERASSARSQQRISTASSTKSQNTVLESLMAKYDSIGREINQLNQEALRSMGEGESDEARLQEINERVATLVAMRKQLLLAIENQRQLDGLSSSNAAGIDPFDRPAPGSRDGWTSSRRRGHHGGGDGGHGGFERAASHPEGLAPIKREISGRRIIVRPAPHNPRLDDDGPNRHVKQAARSAAERAREREDEIKAWEREKALAHRQQLLFNKYDNGQMVKKPDIMGKGGLVSTAAQTDK